MARRVVWKAVRIMLAGMVLLPAIALLPSSAEAGTPWSCRCDGKPKRFIASTHACEHDLYKGTKKRVANAFKLLVPACSRSQWVAWNTKACKLEGCRPPKFD